jgi:chromosome partitioning protein
VISFQMLKGGVAKTSSALNFGLRAAQYGARVLFVDLDQQANLSFALGFEDEEHPVWVDVVEKKARIQDVVITLSDNIDLIPSSLNNSVLDRVLLNSQRNWVNAVKNPLQEIRSHYDFVIIDTAPHLSATNSAVTCASELVILPINPDRFSLLGLKKHQEDLQDLKNEFGLNFDEKILLTRFDAREKVSHEVRHFCEEQFSEKLFSTVIRTSTEVKNTLHRGRSLFSVKSVAKEDYDLLTREVLGWI